jgi:epoxyqueuosine reductase
MLQLREQFKMDQSASIIRDKAIAIGFSNCGIIKIHEVDEYREKLDQRISLFPEIKEHSLDFYEFTELNKKYNWAKSIIVCISDYNKYKLPENLEGLIGKYYLFDNRTDTDSPEFQSALDFEAYLLDQGIRFESERKFGITTLRWAAAKANLGIFRKNNFIYSENGSYLNIHAWLIDKELEIKPASSFKKCPDGCSMCIKACPTESLCSPYTMNRSSCISCLTTWEGWDLTTNEYSSRLGSWIYGCDVCQDICPFNKNRMLHKIDFPGLEKVSASVSLEKIIEMDYQELDRDIQKKFWYIPSGKLWKWKINALNAIVNNYAPKYFKVIENACSDANENVRKMAEWAMMKIADKK